MKLKNNQEGKKKTNNERKAKRTKLTNKEGKNRTNEIKKETHKKARKEKTLKK